MNDTLHIISGDCPGDLLVKSGVPGEVIVWRDVLYDGPRLPGWPDDNTLDARARFLEDLTGRGLDSANILHTLKEQYRKLAAAAEYARTVLWFDACLFDQSMLVHILTCLHHQGIQNAELLCVDEFPGIVPFHGLGQLQPSQLAALYDQRRPVTDDEFQFATVADKAFANQDPTLLAELSGDVDAPLRWIPAAATRLLQEQPDPVTGLGRLESLALQAIRDGCQTPGEVFRAAAKADTPPQFWGDMTLWAKINGMADRTPPVVLIEGPSPRLPQWDGTVELKRFTIKSALA